MAKPSMSKDRKYILPVVGGRSDDIAEGVDKGKGEELGLNKAICHSILTE